MDEKEIITRRVFLSCLQLICYFKTYELVIPDKVAHRPSATPQNLASVSPLNKNTFNRRESDIPEQRRKSSFLVSDALDKPSTKKIPLKIHIGLGIGEMQHVHIGDAISGAAAATTTVSDGTYSRSEYFIAGKALKNSGILLGFGKPGDFTFESVGNDLVIAAMVSEPSFPPARKSSKDLGRYFLVSDTDPIEKYVDCLIQNLGEKVHISQESESTLVGSKKRNRNFISTILPYIDDALAQSVRRVKRADSNEDLDGMSPFSVDLGNYDQLRGVAVLFLYFPAFNVETVAQPENLEVLQKITLIILGAIRKHQGCLRQFNCDDKSLTALLVWGLEGFAHEKSECYFSMAAAMEIEWQLKKVVGDQFAIGSTKGTVFAGIVGNQNRCDGTLLGVCVNNAARLMCLDSCKGGILCDEYTYMDTNDSIDYDTDIPEVVLKGE
ncbi:Adenylate cyclase type 10 [Physocladia obscura]|uniref:Adenylate cyclase type 10 n=1 Tax=Physocladia obscura TaxID=109957 RepID=A0AAD5TAX3_9FUNG|nr:Adenylate cyclase type 10 [Physocladia obscura]